MKKKLVRIILAGTLLCSAQAYAQDFSSVQGVLGNGVVTNSVLTLEFPRNDLSVQVPGGQLDPNIGIESDINFQQITSQMIQAGRTTASASGITTGTTGVTTGTTGTGTTTGATGAAMSNNTSARAANALTNRTTSGAASAMSNISSTGTTSGAATGTGAAQAMLGPAQAGQMVMTGDICVNDSEEPKVIDQLQKDGIAITAVHEHLINETPDIRFVHVEAIGDGATIAQKLKNSLTIIGTPTATTSSPSSPAQFTDIISVLGSSNAKTEGTVIKYSVPLVNQFVLTGLQVNSGMGSESEVNFQVQSSGSAIANAEFVVEAKAADPMIQSLRSNGFDVAALHNHTLDEVPRLFYLHATGSGSPRNLADAVKAALDIDKANLSQSLVSGAAASATGAAATTGTAGTSATATRTSATRTTAGTGTTAATTRTSATRTTAGTGTTAGNVFRNTTGMATGTTGMTTGTAATGSTSARVAR